MAVGLIGKKLGMTRVFAEDGRWIPVTVLEAGPCAVVQRKTTEKDGYEAVQLGYGQRPERRCTKPELGHFGKAGLAPQQVVREFRVDASSELKAGDQVLADMFSAGERIDVVGVSKGKGFQGVQKRHGFAGGPAGHGSNFHRAPGSVGQSADPAKIVKGKRMPGQMGNKRITTQNLEVVQVDVEKNLMLVRGCVPGRNGGFVLLRKTVKGGK